MKKTLTAFFWGYLAILLETTWGHAVQVGSVRLDGLCDLVIWYSLGSSMPGGLLATLGLGVMAEPFSSLPGGLYIIAFSSAYLLVRYIHNHLFYPPLWQQVLLAGFTSMGMETVLLLGSGATDLLWPWGLVQSVLNGLTYPVWSRLFQSTEEALARLAEEFGERKI